MFQAWNDYAIAAYAIQCAMEINIILLYRVNRCLSSVGVGVGINLLIVENDRFGDIILPAVIEKTPRCERCFFIWSTLNRVSVQRY